MRRILLIIGAMAVATLAGAALWLANLFLPPGPVERVSFEAGDGIVLQGRYFRPAGGAPRTPAIVILHGSGPETGESAPYQMHAVALARSGIGVLVYAKRGVGASGGDFDTATLLDFAADGGAAVRYLRTRADVDAARIGLFGSSEGGWLSPIIAQQDGAVSFIYNRAGPALPWGEVNIYENANELRAAGFGAAEIEAASALRWALWEYYRDAGVADDPLVERRAELERRVESARSEPWFETWSMRVAPFDAETYRNWASDVWLDPRPALRAITVPILATYAGADENVPSAESVRILEQIRAERGGVIDVVVYPGRTHSMFKWRDILTGGYPPDYFSTITNWTRDHNHGA